jgi:hypothetical protein
MLNAIMLNAVDQNVVMLSVAAPRTEIGQLSFILFGERADKE